jgi:hypothetical protein
MEHQPYETWLLNDERLTAEQQRDLRRHTASCLQCAALARANLSLRAAPVARPASGFSQRFARRLAAERQIQRRRTVIGLLLLTLVSSGLIYWLISPLLPYLSLSPTQMFVTWVSALLYLSNTAQALGTLGGVFSRLAFGLVPPSLWVVFLVTALGSGALWVTLLRKTNKTKAYSRARL